ncbi:MAG: Gfo/Idh/MocA family oxidoreductase [Planctomycetota bacterium]
MRKISRRQFIRRTATTVTAAVAMPYIVPSSALGADGATAPSERITMGGIGIGGMGTHDLKNFLEEDDVRFLAVCDVDTEHRNKARDLVNEKYGNRDCAAYNDFYEVLARDDIDALLIATPDHWHALIAIAGAKAGKDMYCEKPISLTIAEGRAVADTMKRYSIVYQSGTQRRSIRCFSFAVEMARTGKVGKLHTIHVNLSEGPSCGVEKPQPIPEGFDYDRWLGQAPYEPYTPKRCHGSFRWLLDYSGGKLTDIGAHFNDLAQWGNDSELTGPIEYEGWGTFPKDGLFNTPVNFEVTATYADGVKMIMNDKLPRAIKLVGDEGWVSVDDDGNVDAMPKSILKLRRFVQQDYSYMKGHHRNFLDCVKTRATTIAPPEVAHRSTTTCHIGNICLRLGRKLRWNPQTERFVNDPEADRMMARAMRSPWHL